MKNKKNVPELRFPEFNSDWKWLTIEEIAQVSSGGTPSRSEPRFWNGDIPWITTSEIGQTAIHKSIEMITEEGLKNSSAKIFNKYTILLAMYGQGKTRGLVSILKIEATTNQACAAITPKNCCNSKFLYYYLFRQYENLRLLSNDGSQKNLSSGLIKQYKVPQCTTEEQEKIASFLSAVDKKLTQFRRKKELLESYKRGLMQKFFTHKIGLKKREKTPEFRFPNFLSDWQPRKFNEFIIKKNINASDNIPLYSLTIENGVTEKIERYERNFLVKNEDEAYKLVEPNDFVYNPMNVRLGALAKHKKDYSVKVSKYYDVFTVDKSVNVVSGTINWVKSRQISITPLNTTGRSNIRKFTK
jgi:type I restriction enzyme S subunit